MHDIWNPWHGCRKCSEGCENCYMYFLDRIAGAGRKPDLPDEERLPLSVVKGSAGEVQSKERRDDPGMYDLGFFS